MTIFKSTQTETEINKNIDWYTVIARLVILGALIVVAGISLFSEFGVHPDEWDVRVCMDWGITHWIWPDMRAQGLGDTYSWYGYTKVCNYTPYFLIMGKIAGVFKRFMDVLPYFRMPNLLLMLGMAIVCIRKMRDKKYLMLAFGMCVQAWYIFAYVTADALDFVWAFIAIYLLADENSLLWRSIKVSDTRRAIVGCIVLGLLYGCMLLGKPYYYANMVITFIVLVMHLVKASFNERKVLWMRYLIIVGVCGLVFLGRFGLDVHYYGSDKATVKEQMAEKYSSDDKKPSTPIEEQCITYHMAEKGYSVSDLFKYDEHWFAKSYRSFVSARVTISGDNWYYVIMALLYAVIYVWLGISLWTGKGNVMMDRIVLVSGTILNVGGNIASVMNSYLIDAQAQGRYLLPIILTTSYMASRVPKLWENKIFKVVVLTAGVLSVMYFGLFDSRKLIDLAYVRSIL